ncbi:hypothetical protein FQN57_003713 [Myotisia sp. PD_48]|nr:hypothetical protein FQN57_003713 [Myotisia sp. PD_48]
MWICRVESRAKGVLCQFTSPGYVSDRRISHKHEYRSFCGSGPTPYEYRGPMIAVRSLAYDSYGDITLSDFRHLIDYIVSYRSTVIHGSVQEHAPRAITVIRGVKISCYGEIKLHGCEPFVSVDVPRAARATLGQGNESQISSRLGRPLLLWKDPDYEFREGPPGWPENTPPDSNPNAASLMRRIHLEEEGWGWVVDFHWLTDIGNVLVLREDGEDLRIEEVEMMCRFSTNILQRRIEDALKSEPGSKERREVWDFITWGNMVKHSGKAN